MRAFRSIVRRICGFAASLTVLTLMLLAMPAAIADDDTRFEVRSASIAPSNGVYLLNAKLHFALPDGARQAIRDGVALTLSVEIQVQRARRWWLDETVATLSQHYEIVYHALSQNYLLRNLNSGEQTAYGTFEGAVESLSNLREVPVLDQSLLDKDEAYEVRMRAMLDVKTLPDTLRLVLFWTDDWRQKTDWYVWPLKL